MSKGIQREPNLSSCGASNAARRRRVGLQAALQNRLPTTKAKAIFALVHTGECCLDLDDALLAAALGRLGHRLALHGVHPRQPPHTLLIQRNRRAISPGRGTQLGSLPQFRLKRLLQLRVQVFVFHTRLYTKWVPIETNPWGRRAPMARHCYDAAMALMPSSLLNLAANLDDRTDLTPQAAL